MKAYVSRVTANGADLQGDATFSEAVALIFEGVNLGKAFIEVQREGVVYTPLVFSSNEFYFLLMDNGQYHVSIDGVKFALIRIEGIVVPDVLPARLTAFQTDRNVGNVPNADKHNLMTITSANCINYPFTVNEDWPRFTVDIGKGIGSGHVFSFHNCTDAGHAVAGNWARAMGVVQDVSQPAFIMMDGFIIFVFNYQQPRRRRR